MDIFNVIGDAKMGTKGKIAQYRETLDKTLASNNLTDEKTLQNLVKDQILRSSVGKNTDYTDYVLEKRAAEVSNFLEMLRSASNEYGASENTHQPSWKVSNQTCELNFDDYNINTFPKCVKALACGGLKQDTEEFRVMYREGPVGSPLHSLLVEGYIDAPLDVCLCVSWETALYPRWFPDMLIPTFKVVEAKSLQKVMIGEEISLVRVKLSWPMSSREAILHCFAFEYLEDDLVIVLMNTIPVIDDIQSETHGFTNEGIPEVGNTVRIDLTGGFALQRVTETRSYFRTIANMDIKLDFVPPSLINFISRQVIGSGFKFYQKTVASVSKGEEAFAKVLSGPLYCRIREAVVSKAEAKNLETQNINNCTIISNGKEKVRLQDASGKDVGNAVGSTQAEYHVNGCEPSNNDIQEEESCETNTKQHETRLGDMFNAGNETIYCNSNVNGYLMQYKPITEIEEEKVGGIDSVVNNDNFTKPGCSLVVDQFPLVNLNKNVPISPQVEKALGTLDKMINAVRDGKLRAQSGLRIVASDAKLPTTRTNVELSQQTTTDQVSTVSTAPNGLRDYNFQAQGANPALTLTSPLQSSPIESWARNAVSAGNSPVVERSVNLDIHSSHKNNKKNAQPRKWRFCCLHIVSGRI